MVILLILIVLTVISLVSVIETLHVMEDSVYSIRLLIIILVIVLVLDTRESTVLVSTLGDWTCTISNDTLIKIFFYYMLDSCVG